MRSSIVSFPATVNNNPHSIVASISEHFIIGTCCSEKEAFGDQTTLEALVFYSVYTTTVKDQPFTIEFLVSPTFTNRLIFLFKISPLMGFISSSSSSSIKDHHSYINRSLSIDRHLQVGWCWSSSLAAMDSLYLEPDGQPQHVVVARRWMWEGRLPMIMNRVPWLGCWWQMRRSVWKGRPVIVIRFGDVGRREQQRK